MKLNKYGHFLPLYIEFKGLTFTYYIISSRNLTQKWCTNGVQNLKKWCTKFFFKSHMYGNLLR